MLEADIILRGQGTDEQQMVPIVASPPTVTSDLSFQEWINVVKNGQKGFELHFHSTEAVELTLQSLQGLEQVRTPFCLFESKSACCVHSFTSINDRIE